MRQLKNFHTEAVDYDFFVTYRDKADKHRVEVEAGHLCDVEVELFRDKEHTYVLSWNQRFPYVGIERFLGNQRSGNLYLSSHEAIEDTLGPNAFELPSITIAKKLSSRVVSPQPSRRRGGPA